MIKKVTIHRRYTRNDASPVRHYVVDLFTNCSSPATTSPQQIHTNWNRLLQIHNISTSEDVVDFFWALQQVHNKSKQWSLGFDLLWTSP